MSLQICLELDSSVMTYTNGIPSYVAGPVAEKPGKTVVAFETPQSLVLKVSCTAENIIGF